MIIIIIITIIKREKNNEMWKWSRESGKIKKRLPSGRINLGWKKPLRSFSQREASNCIGNGVSRTKQSGKVKTKERRKEKKVYKCKYVSFGNGRTTTKKIPNNNQERENKTKRRWACTVFFWHLAFEKLWKKMNKEKRKKWKIMKWNETRINWMKKGNKTNNKKS